MRPKNCMAEAVSPTARCPVAQWVLRIWTPNSRSQALRNRSPAHDANWYSRMTEAEPSRSVVCSEILPFCAW